MEAIVDIHNPIKDIHIFQLKSSTIQLHIYT